MTVLVVDDSRAMRSIVIRALRQAGYHDHATYEAATGTQALELIGTTAPDLVLTDWNMPEMTGIECLQAVRAAGLHVEFGFVASAGCPSMRDAAFSAGAAFYITKPFTAQTFRDALATVLDLPLTQPAPIG